MYAPIISDFSIIVLFFIIGYLAFQSLPELKTLIRNTNLRDKPTTKGSKATLYLTNTTLYVLEKSVAKADGFTWDKVRIRVNGKEGYMINQNYK